MIRLILFLTLNHCAHPQLKFRKQSILDPSMDPAKTSLMGDRYLEGSATSHENASSPDSQSAGGSCPTCGA